MAVIIDSILKKEKLLLPVNHDASGYYLPVKASKFSGKLGIQQETVLYGSILKIVGMADYLNTDDLKDFENMNIKMYINPAGCGPNDGLFFSIETYRLMDNHSIIPDKYRVKIIINRTESGEIKDSFDVTYE
ncbi:MAG: hypothetical protein QXZ44_02240 [Ferroplasma sp.]